MRVVELGDIATIDRKSIKPEDIQDGALYVGLEHITNDGKFDDVLTVVNGELSSSKFCFDDRHLLYGKLRPYLKKIALPSFKGICSTDILPILSGPEIDKRYLFYFLRQQSIIDLATSMATGVNLPRLSPKQLVKFEIPLPPLAEQQHIAAILDQADALRAKRRAALVKLDTLLQATFLDMFGDPVRNPMGWETLTMEDVILDGPQNGLYRPASDYGSGTPIIRIDSFYAGKVVGLARLKRLRIEPETQKKYRVQKNEILINRVNSREYLGKCAIVPLLNEPTVFESNMMRLAVDNALILPQFLVSQMQHQYVKMQILGRCKDAVNQSSINQEDVKSFELRIPPLELQEKFVCFLKKIESIQVKLLQNTKQLDNLFHALQQRAFKGEL